jgi:internalin A
MSTVKIWTCLGLCALVAAACDDKKTETASQPEAAPPPAATSAPAPAPTPPPAPTVAFKKRTLADCKPHTVDFNDDAALEAQVRLKTSKATGPITPADLATIKSINLSQAKDIHQIDPCLFPMLTSMKDLFLGTGDYDDLTPLSKIATLESLRASGSQVKDLHPIEGLKRLDRLDLSHTLISDDNLKSVSGLVNVTELMLDEDTVTDLTPVSAMKKLEKLSIKNTGVKSLTPVSQLKTLKYLYIAGIPASDITPVQPLISNGLKLVTN